MLLFNQTAQNKKSLGVLPAVKPTAPLTLLKQIQWTTSVSAVVVPVLELVANYNFREVVLHLKKAWLPRKKEKKNTGQNDKTQVLLQLSIIFNLQLHAKTVRWFTLPGHVFSSGTVLTWPGLTSVFQ